MQKLALVLTLAHVALQWLDAEHLLAISNEGLVLLDLDGNAKVLDPAGTGLVRR